MTDADSPDSDSPASFDLSELRGLDPAELLARGLDTVRPSGGAAVWSPPPPEELGRLLPQFRILSLIGRGGMGAVYKAVQLNLERPVAIKLLPVEIAANKQFIARFQREARILAKLQHPRIVTVHDIGQTSEGHFYFVMEYIDGTDLRSILKGPGLDPEQALVVVGQVCDALQAAHREGIVHRDIKPENLLITRDGYVKLADFGLARPPQDEDASMLTNTDMVMGTLDYMSPEQRLGADVVDHRSDIFALGVMFYEILTGHRPRGVFDPPSRKAHLDARIDDVVLKALQSEPERRYQNASEMKTDVDRIRSTPPNGVPQVSAPAPAPMPQPHRLGLGIAAAILLPILAFASYLIFKKSGRETTNEGIPARTQSVMNPPATASVIAPSPAPTVKKPSTPVSTIAKASPTPPVVMAAPTTPRPPPAPVVATAPAAAVQKPATPAMTPIPAAAPPATNLLQSFSKQVPNISAWVLAPLDQSIPADIRQNLTFLREDLADAAARQRTASPDAYRIGAQLCNTLLAVSQERDQARARAGFRAVEANARTGVSSQVLEARRNYMMSWPQYAREAAHREEIKSEAMNNAQVMKERPKLEWSQRAAQLGNYIDGLYSQFRSALRQTTR